MNTTVDMLIEKLEEIEDKSLPVFAIVGSSGIAYEVSSPSVQTHEQKSWDVNDWEYLGINEGDQYVQLYIGN